MKNSDLTPDYNNFILQLNNQSAAAKIPHKNLLILGILGSLAIGLLPNIDSSVSQLLNCSGSIGQNYFIQNYNCNQVEDLAMLNNITPRSFKFKAMHLGSVQCMGNLPIYAVTNLAVNNHSALRYKRTITARIQRRGKLPISPIE